jgi:site-specific recombinase XerD
LFHQYFEKPRVLRGIESGDFQKHLDSFAQELGVVGFAREHARNQLRAAAHLCVWAGRQRVTVEGFSDDLISRFHLHLPQCQCPGPKRGRCSLVAEWAQRFVEHLRRVCVLPAVIVDPKEARPVLLQEFLTWMRQHRGVGEASLRRYEYHLVDLLDCLGDDPSHFTAQKLRGFVQQQSTNYSSTGGTKKLFTAVRMFLRHLTIEGKCPAGLNHALPSLAGWSQQGVPRCLPAADVETLIAACDQTDKVGMRDRAILLLLARLGLRAGDVASLRLPDISWPQATIRVSGKGQREALLPLPQDVGDAILTYLEIGRPHVESDYIFLRCCAPFRPFAHGGPVSLIVRRAFLKSGIKSPSLGSHVLRHSVASEMLRQGTPLYGIATVLRHRSIETTTIYAKVDLDLLRGVAQPWPEVLR